MSRRKALALAVSSSVVLAASRIALADDPQATIEALQRGLDEKDATVEALQTRVATLLPTGTPTPSPTASPAASSSQAVITEFGQEATVRYLLDRWELNFESAVECRCGISHLQPYDAY